MAEQDLVDKVFRNPHIVTRITRLLDVRSLARTHSISKDFYRAAVSESERRKRILQTVFLWSCHWRDQNRSSGLSFCHEFSDFTKNELKIRPKNVILMGSDQQNPIDYRQRVIKCLTEYLPKNCRIVFMEVESMLTSLAFSKNATNNHIEQLQRSQVFPSTAFACMPCVLIPDMDGIEIRTYNRLQDVNINDVKCILLFISSKKLIRKKIFELRENILQTKRDIFALMGKIDGNISFGGGTVGAILTEECPLLSEQLIVTFSGQSVRTSSCVISTSNEDEFMSQLQEFKNGLNFDYRKKRFTFGYLFANNSFPERFSDHFQNVFPSVHIFGFKTDRMYGKHFNRIYEDINESTQSVIVLINFYSKRYQSKYQHKCQLIESTQ